MWSRGLKVLVAFDCDENNQAKQDGKREDSSGPWPHTASLLACFGMGRRKPYREKAGYYHCGNDEISLLNSNVITKKAK